MMREPFTDTITLYHHFIDPDTRNDKWKRTVLRGVQWSKTRDKTISASGVVQVADLVTVTIPFGVDSGGDAWTIDVKSNLDFIVFGEVTQDLTDDYPPSAFRKVHDSCATVKSVADNTNRRFLKHWSVVAV